MIIVAAVEMATFAVALNAQLKAMFSGIGRTEQKKMTKSLMPENLRDPIIKGNTRGDGDLYVVIKKLTDTDMLRGLYDPLKGVIGF